MDEPGRGKQRAARLMKEAVSNKFIEAYKLQNFLQWGITWVFNLQYMYMVQISRGICLILPIQDFREQKGIKHS